MREYVHSSNSQGEATPPTTVLDLSDQIGRQYMAKVYGARDRASGANDIKQREDRSREKGQGGRPGDADNGMMLAAFVPRQRQKKTKGQN